MSLQMTGIIRSTAVWIDREYVYRPLLATNSHPSHVMVPRDVFNDCVGSSSLQVIHVNRGNPSGMQTSVNDATQIVRVSRIYTVPRPG
jgi:hypothetical protein